jgi:hypothetical protein
MITARDISTVRFSATDVARVYEIATARFETKRAVGSVDKRIARDATSVEIDARGVLGELAVARFLGLPTDPILELYAGGDGGADLTTPGGATIDVKTGGRWYYDFAIRSTRVGEFRADLGVLCWLNADTPQRVAVAGWLTRAEFHKMAQTVNFGYGDRLAVTWSRLRKMLELQQLIAEGQQNRTGGAKCRTRPSITTTTARTATTRTTNLRR